MGLPLGMAGTSAARVIWLSVFDMPLESGLVLPAGMPSAMPASAQQSESSAPYLRPLCLLTAMKTNTASTPAASTAATAAIQAMVDGLVLGGGSDVGAVSACGSGCCPGRGGRLHDAGGAEFSSRRLVSVASRDNDGNLRKLAGMSPVRLFPLKVSERREIMALHSVGIVPVRLLSPRLIRCRRVRAAHASPGRVPLKWLASRLTSVSVEILPSATGSAPDKAFMLRSSSRSRGMSPHAGGT
mmetsp:Transcript_42290/g.109681  ORF Transcript_42290/g.109681 Transcript_42290/m.109681 type:complete len:242 (+) Transcript_42290:1595-2320(+)